jgi:TonB-linked SusC/RagA family outer membrane protein
MKKKWLCPCVRPGVSKILTKMKLTIFLLLTSMLGAFASVSYSQSAKLTLKYENSTVKEILTQIEDQSEFRFFYSGSVDVDRKASISMKNEKIFTVLDKLFEGTAVKYEVLGKQIALVKENESIKFKNVESQQQNKISGTVTEENGQPLPGVTVVVKGTTLGTITNEDGEYTLANVPDDATIQFSFVGMITQEVIVGNQSTIDITMMPDAIGIEEVVAIGYGTLERNKISTSITSVAPEKIKAQVTSSIDQSLEGQVAGLSVRQTSGAPGGGSELRIRGSGSIGAGDQPLFVIDGIPMQGIYGKDRSPLTLLNQNDIESIDVLKGVSATAIYGSRGSNGVILVTTRSGKVGKTEISFSARTGIENMLSAERMDLMNAEEFARWRKEDAYEEAAFYGYEISESDIPEVYRNPEALGEGTDWQDVMTRTALRQDYNLTVTHGAGDFKGFFSMGYLDNQGIVKETSFERISMRANMSYEPNKIVAVGMNVVPTIRTWYNQVGGNRGTLFGSAFMSSPLDGPYKEDGAWERDIEGYYEGDWDLDIWSPGTFSNNNPLYSLNKQVDVTRNLNLRFQPYITLSPIEGLLLKSAYNMDLSYNSREYFRQSTISSIYSPPPQATDGYYDTDRSLGWQFENTATYNNQFGDHGVTALAGYTMEHYNNYSSYINGDQFSSDAIKTINAATEQWGNTGESNWSLISYLLRLSYDYKAKYLFTGTIRRDGSSRFGSDRRWGYFPSASVGWNITKESFFPSPEWLTNLKLRASYGYSGNNSIGNYTWIPTLSTNNYAFGGSVADGKRVASMANYNLGWEKSREFDAGLDLILLGGKLSFVFDYYNKITEDMLWGVAVPISSGFSSVQDNIGEIQNQGVEFAVSSTNVSKRDFTWNTDFNISFNRNEVLDMGDVGRIQTGARSYSLTIEGQPMAMFYGWKSLGILNDWDEVDQYATFPGQVPGTPRYQDLDNSGVIDQDDKMIIGNPHPDFRGGLTNSFRYNNWDLNIAMSFAHNFDIWAQLEEDVINLDGVFNVLKEVKERWRSPEEPGNGRIAASFHETKYDRWENSDWVYNASFLKVQNISLGYNVGGIEFINSLRLYLSVQNAFLLTNYPYGNPEASVYGDNSLVRNFDNYDYPLTRTITFGLDLTF